MFRFNFPLRIFSIRHISHRIHCVIISVTCPCLLISSVFCHMYRLLVNQSSPLRVLRSSLLLFVVVFLPSSLFVFCFCLCTLFLLPSLCQHTLRLASVSEEVRPQAARQASRIFRAHRWGGGRAHRRESLCVPFYFLSVILYFISISTLVVLFLLIFLFFSSR